MLFNHDQVMQTAHAQCNSHQFTKQVQRASLHQQQHTWPATRSASTAFAQSQLGCRLLFSAASDTEVLLCWLKSQDGSCVVADEWLSDCSLFKISSGTSTPVCPWPDQEPPGIARRRGLGTLPLRMAPGFATAKRASFRSFATCILGLHEQLCVPLASEHVHIAANIIHQM